jgi:spermidine synthase
MTPHSRVDASPAARPQGLPLWAALCFLASGAAGLIYEVVWSREIAYVLGNSLHAVSTVVAAFLTGLALGAYVVGARIAHLRRGARAYALLELGIGVMGLLSIPLLHGLDPVAGVLYRLLGGETGPFALARFLLLFVLLLPPTALMGATLPVLVGHFEYHGVGPALARLYALNTAGAVLGSVLAGFVLMPGIGLTASTWVAAALNAGSAALAWLAAGRVPASGETAETAPALRASPRTGSPRHGTPLPAKAAPASEFLAPLLPRGSRRAVAVLFALSGGGALAFQLAWVRLFGLMLGSSVYSFSAVLAVYLAGLAAGSALVAPWFRGVEKREGAARLLVILGGLQLALAIVALATVYLFPRLPEMVYALGRETAGHWAPLYAGEVGLVALVLLLPCLGFGAIFPVATRLLQSRDGGHATGLGYAVNTAGTLAGSLLAGFILIPALGVQGTHVAAALLAALVGVAALALAGARGLSPVRAVAGAAIGAGAALALAAQAPRWDPALMSAGVYRPARIESVQQKAGAAPHPVRRHAHRELTLFYREGLNASVYVSSDSARRNLYLKIGGKTDASTADMLTQVMLGVLPGAMAPPGARAAVVGLGSGATLAALLATGVGPVEVMELEPAVVAASRYFDEPGRAPLDDPRVRLVLGDARTHLYNTRETYDLITSEPSNPWLAGINNLFTVDFYRRVRSRLAPGGVFCQWIQLYELSPQTLGSLLASFLEVFPTGQAFYLAVAKDLLLVAAPPGASLPLERLRRPEVAHQLRRARQIGPESVAAWYACPFDSLRHLARGAPLNTDDRPVVEFRAPRDLYRAGWMERTRLRAPPIPRAGWRVARALFAGWPPEVWFRGRVREFVNTGQDAAADATIRDAAAEQMAGVADELTRVVAEDRRTVMVGRLQRKASTATFGGRLEEARDLLLEAARLAPENGLTWAALASVLLTLGDEGGALAAVKRAVAVGDSLNRGDARMVEGLIALTRGQARAAAGAFAEAIRWEPQAEQAWLMRARALAQAGDTAGAVDACRRGIENATSTDRLRSLLAELTSGR